MQKLLIIFLILLLSGCLSKQPVHQNQINHLSETTEYKLVHFDVLVNDISQNIVVNAKLEKSFDINSDKMYANQPIESTANLSWKNIYIKSNTPDIHFNINQPAKLVDSNATNWSQVFRFDASFRNNLDILYFCGSTTIFNLQVLDIQNKLLLYDGAINGIKSCA